MVIKKLLDFRDITMDNNLIRLFEVERVKINTKRLNYFVEIVALIYLFLLITDIFIFKLKWYLIIGYRNIILTHIITTVFLVIYFIIRYYENKINIKNKDRFDRIIFLFCYYITILLCTLIAINSQTIHKQISSYLISVFIVVSFGILSPLEGAIMLFTSYAFLITGLSITANNMQSFFGHLINSTIFIILGYMFVIINYRTNLNNFISKITIDKKSEDLVRINEELNNEMEKAKLLYKEKSMLLNKALEYEHLRTNFFSNISHELKTPINVIYCSQQMLEANFNNSNLTETKDKNEKYTQIIKQNCYRLLRLTNNLIDITKIDSGRLKLKMGNYDIIRIVEDIVLSVVPYAEIKELSLIFDTDIEEKVIACDPIKIERIILNLLSNAIKFTRPEGNILVNINDFEDHIKISVKDTGIGIPKDKQNLVFERFVQLDSTLSRNNEGSGIGLALVKMLVEMHNGSVQLISEKGKGSEFIINLPCPVLKEVINQTSNDSTSLSSTEDRIERINIEFSDIYF